MTRLTLLVPLALLTATLAFTAPAAAEPPVNACAQWLLDTPLGGHACALGIPDGVPKDCVRSDAYEPGTRTGAVAYACVPDVPYSSAYVCAQWLVDDSFIHHACPLGMPPQDRAGCAHWQFYEPDTRSGAVVLLCE